jgi:hypothetical protein
MSVPIDRVAVQAAVDALAKTGNIAEAARTLNKPRATVVSQLAMADRLGFRPAVVAHDDPAALKATVKRLEKELAALEAKALTEDTIKRHIVGLARNAAETPTPPWVTKPQAADSAPGVPTLFLSDLHWGEVVHPSQINGVNKYNVEIAHRRMEALGERAVRLLSIISPKMEFPGIVLVLGGDMISGNIHDELTATNELNSMEAVLDLFAELTKLIAMLATRFGKVFVPCVTGNHGRDTVKIWGKDRHKTSFDWLLYCFLAKRFENDRRVTFLIPDGPDAYFKVCSHRYLLTHGDQFRGGDGLIGALGPIIRGDHKKRSRNAQIDMEYDTLLLGHFHQYMHLTRLIVNGSLKGMDEYAYSNNFPYEKPQQALWLTHPKYGITYRCPIYVDRGFKATKTAWVSVAA